MNYEHDFDYRFIHEAEEAVKDYIKETGCKAGFNHLYNLYMKGAMAGLADFGEDFDGEDDLLDEEEDYADGEFHNYYTPATSEYYTPEVTSEEKSCCCGSCNTSDEAKAPSQLFSKCRDWLMQLSFRKDFLKKIGYVSVVMSITAAALSFMTFRSVVDAVLAAVVGEVYVPYYVIRYLILGI